MTLEQLIAIMPTAQQRATRFFPYLSIYMREFGIEGAKREAAFLATIAVESGELRYTREIWGPTPQQERYEGREDLGNTEPGDGERFKGRGLVQITGRSNYAKVGEALQHDFIASPPSLEAPDFACASACWFFASHGCNELADADNFKAVTKRVNGGLTAYDRRLAYYEKALQVLSATGEPS